MSDPSKENRTLSNLASLRNDVADTTNVLKVTVDKLVDREDRLNALSARADDLNSSSYQFHGSARRVQRRMKWQSYRMTIIISELSLFLVLLTSSISVLFSCRHSPRHRRDCLDCPSSLEITSRNENEHFLSFLTISETVFRLLRKAVLLRWSIKADFLSESDLSEWLGSSMWCKQEQCTRWVITSVAKCFLMKNRRGLLEKESARKVKVILSSWWVGVHRWTRLKCSKCFFNILAWNCCTSLELASVSSSLLISFGGE